MSMKNKFSKLIILLLTTCAMQTAKAENYSYLTLQYGGVQQSIALNTLKKITFSGGQLHATTAEGVQSIKLSTMEKMFFSSTATAIQSAKMDAAFELGYDAASQMVMLNGMSGRGVVEVYSVNGTKALRETTSLNGGQVSLASLPKGLYIVKVNGKVLKVTR